MDNSALASEIVFASHDFGRRRSVATSVLFVGLVKASARAPPFHLEDMGAVGF